MSAFFVLAALPAVLHFGGTLTGLLALQDCCRLTAFWQTAETRQQRGGWLSWTIRSVSSVVMVSRTA